MLGLAGQASQLLVCWRLGVIVTNDGKPLAMQIQAAQSLLEEGIKVVTGGHPSGIVDEDFAVMVKNPGIPYSNLMVEKGLKKSIPVLTE